MIVELACGLAHLLKGSLTENASTKVDLSIRQPLCVVGIISPFNFPASAYVVLTHRHRPDLAWEIPPLMV